MINIQKYADHGHVDHGWLNARHHFSFGSYVNRERMGFGPLRVVNDDQIRAGRGFDFHPHDNMEIITYVKNGSISHQDNLGNKGITEAGDVQVMSAGTGIVHAEHNRGDVTTELFQIWVQTNKRDITPRWDSKKFPKAPVKGTLPLLVSGNDTDEALYIQQDAKIYGGNILSGNEVHHKLAQKRRAYIIIVQGSVQLNRITLGQGDAAEVTDEHDLHIIAQTDAEILVLDLP